MNRLDELIDLSTLPVEDISMTDLRKAPGGVLRQVHLGRTFRITHGGKPVAMLSPWKSLTSQEDEEARLERTKARLDRGIIRDGGVDR